MLIGVLEQVILCNICTPANSTTARTAPPAATPGQLPLDPTAALPHSEELRGIVVPTIELRSVFLEWLTLRTGLYTELLELYRYKSTRPLQCHFFWELRNITFNNFNTVSFVCSSSRFLLHCLFKCLVSSIRGIRFHSLL